MRAELHPQADVVDVFVPGRGVYVICRHGYQWMEGLNITCYNCQKKAPGLIRAAVWF